MEVLNYKQFKVTDEMLASKSKRFLNYIIDLITLYLLFFLIGILLGIIALLIGSEGMLNFLENLEFVHPLLDRLITALVFAILYFVFESISQRSIGKLFTKTKVVSENGEKPAPEAIAIRSLSRFIPFEPFSFLGDSSRGWHDTFSKTYVVDSKIFDEQRQSHRDYLQLGKTDEPA